MSKIGTEEVIRIARLAQIGLSPDEAAAMAVELGAIVGFVEKLQAVDIENVEPTNQVTGLSDVFRADIIKPSTLTREQLLANAPDQQDGQIKVKRVLG